MLFTDEFYANAARILTGRGLVVNQCGVPFMQADELRETSARRAKFFPHVSAYVAAVPTYVGGFMTLGWAAKDAGLTRLTADEIRGACRGGGRARDDAVLDAGDPCRGVQPAAVHRRASAAVAPQAVRQPDRDPNRVRIIEQRLTFAAHDVRMDRIRHGCDGT